MTKALLTFAFILLVFSASAQNAPAFNEATLSNTPQRKSNLIIIQSPDSGTVALQKLSASLVQQGYIIEQTDARYLTVITRPKNLPKGHSVALTIQANATGGASSRVFLSGQYKIDAATLGTITNIAEYVGMDGGANKIAFRELEAVAKLYPGATSIRYAQR